ncbi:GNAT family N-acetyltransferase [Marinomonas balearica]|uniref:RimJ/RimL family protein N-acetyltransferase n=1 Tax=Marinomonas balearica TaxID=491947 RepID=A0A4R6M6L5_9GAMM|nr:GNAT family protein [Marinomonas balearica]TDO96230.1 RimJ/RimL family protein N-acetyltransferase [Marinomonas balearica]
MNSFSRYQILFRPVVKEDIEQLRLWRNREDIRSVMASDSVVSEEQQSVWFASLSSSSKVHFSLSFRGELIGYANVTFKDNLAETGLYIGHDKYRGTFLSFCVGFGLSEWCFEQSNIEEIKATVLSTNEAALRYNESLGYQKKKEEGGWVYLTKSLTELEGAKLKLSSLLERFNDQKS